MPSLTSGGAERVLITFMNGVDHSTHDPVFLSVSDDGELHYLIDPSIQRHCLNKKLSLWALPSLYFKLRALRPDIIVSTMAHMNFAVLLLKPFLPETVFIIREAITPSFLFKKYAPWDFLIKSLYKILYPTAQIILSPTQKIFDEFRDLLSMDSSRFTLIRNPVDEEKMRKDITLPPITDKRKKTVHFIACGRLTKQKGFDRLIQSLPALNMPYDWTLDILGEGDERENLEKLIKENALHDHVFLKGLVKEPYKAFATADCFLLPSRFEGLPNVVLESLACGTPVIATRESGGIDEIEKDAPARSIQIVDEMDNFMKAMSAIEPYPKKTFRSSLLPDVYKKETALKHFNNILDTSSHADTVPKPNAL